MTIVLHCGFSSPPLRSNKRLHHMAEHRIKRDIRQAGFVAGHRLVGPAPIGCGHTPAGQTIRVVDGEEWWFPLSIPVYIRMVWTVPTKHRRDADSGQPTLKCWIDGMVSAGVLVDDDWQHVPRAYCEIEHAPNQLMSVRVEITPAKEQGHEHT